MPEELNAYMAPEDTVIGVAQRMAGFWHSSPWTGNSLQAGQLGGVLLPRSQAILPYYYEYTFLAEKIPGLKRGYAECDASKLIVSWELRPVSLAEASTR